MLLPVLDLTPRSVNLRTEDRRQETGDLTTMLEMRRREANMLEGSAEEN